MLESSFSVEICAAASKTLTSTRPSRYLRRGTVSYTRKLGRRRVARLLRCRHRCNDHRQFGKGCSHWQWRGKHGVRGERSEEQKRSKNHSKGYDQLGGFRARGKMGYVETAGASYRDRQRSTSGLCMLRVRCRGAFLSPMYLKSSGNSKGSIHLLGLSILLALN